MLFFVALFIWIPCAIVAQNVAKAKGLNSGDWALAAFLLGPIGLLGVVGMPDRKLNSYIQAIAIKLEAVEISAGIDDNASASDAKSVRPLNAKPEYIYVEGTISNLQERAAVLIKQLPPEIQLEASVKRSGVRFGKMSFILNNEGEEIARAVYVRFNDGFHVYKLG